MSTPSDTVTINMEELLETSPAVGLEPGDIVEASVVTAYKNEVWLDLGPHGLGRVARRELNPHHQLQSGDPVTASVVEGDSDLGFAIMSLKKVAKEKGWEVLARLQESGQPVEVSPYDANRGGLLVEVEGIRGFLPVSQLSAQHYPRVSGADKDQILQKLHELVKQPLQVSILDLNREENKLIVSEKEAAREVTREKLGQLKVGDKVKGRVTGTVDFGIFVSIDGIEGLVHISEISWDRVANPASVVKPGEEVAAKVIAIDGDKLSLSMKQLQEDPWLQQIKNYHQGDEVKGTITRVTPFGAFIQIAPAIEALVHISELGEGAEPAEHFTVGDSQNFRIISIDTDMRKISLQPA